MSRFGFMNAIDGLAGGDVTKYESVLLTDYGTIRLKMQMNVELIKINRKFYKNENN